MNQRQLNSLVKKLCKFLGIVGWNVTTKIVAQDKIETEGAFAETSWEPEWKTATVYILSPAYFTSQGLSFQQFLIHELLHILFEGHKPVNHGPYDPPYEYAINNIAKILDNTFNGHRSQITRKASTGASRPVKGNALEVSNGFGVPLPGSTELSRCVGRNSRTDDEHASKISEAN